VRASGRLAIAVTQFRPQFKGLVLDTFESKADLIDAVIASCSFVPVTVRGNPCADGLLTNFFAPLPAAAAGSYDTVLKVRTIDPVRESGPGGLTREVDTPLPSNSPHDHMILREDLVGSHGRWTRPCLQTAHVTICY
jgi:hypothetical protein